MQFFVQPPLHALTYVYIHTMARNKANPEQKGLRGEGNHFPSMDPYLMSLGSILVYHNVRPLCYTVIMTCLSSLVEAEAHTATVIKVCTYLLAICESAAPRKQEPKSS